MVSISRQRGFWVGILVALGPVTLALAHGYGSTVKQVSITAQQIEKIENQNSKRDEMIFANTLTNSQQTIILQEIARRLDIIDGNKRNYGLINLPNTPGTQEAIEAFNNDTQEIIKKR